MLIGGAICVVCIVMRILLLSLLLLSPLDLAAVTFADYVWISREATSPWESKEPSQLR